MSAPTMTLYTNTASPFARKVLILLHETGQLDRVALQQTALTPTNDINPSEIFQNSHEFCQSWTS